MFRSDNLEKSDRKSIFKLKMVKISMKKKVQQMTFLDLINVKDSPILILLCRCFETLIVCPWLFVAIHFTETSDCVVFIFFQILHFKIGGAAYLWMRLIHGRLRYVV